MCVYMDNSCEVHYDSGDNSKLILSPCASEFVFRTYADNVIKNTLKYRTAYAISIFSSKLRTILRERNRFCSDQPFISPILLEEETQYWFSSEDLSIARWNTTPMALDVTNPIEIDYSSFFYIWKSDCKNVKARLHFNKKIFSVTYPVKVPTSENDEYELKFESYSRFKQNKSSSKHIFKFTLNEQEFSVNHLAPQWKELVSKMLRLVEKISDEPRQLSILQENESTKKSEIAIRLPEAMPLSCSSTHLHRFDNIETTSEPKVIYRDKTWYKMFYRSKSIEISCPSVYDELKLDEQRDTYVVESNCTVNQAALSYDYLISDTVTGRYFSCFSLNKRSGNVEDVKICSENIPSFKVHLKKTINYAQIFLKRIDSIKVLSNYSICYSSKKFDRIIGSQEKSISNIPSVTIDQIKNGQLSSSTNTSLVSNASEYSDNSNIKRQFVIENIGHFKYMKSNMIVINFIGKVKLYMDEYSIGMYLEDKIDECNCSIYLPDNSQHEVYLKDSSVNNHFSKYISFLVQWLNWLIDNNAFNVSKTIRAVDPCEVNYTTMQAHLNNLKQFNYAMKQDSIVESLRDNFNGQFNEPTTLSISNLLRENNNFLKNISEQV